LPQIQPNRLPSAAVPAAATWFCAFAAAHPDDTQRAAAAS
jgi:hypothetical protein